MTKSPPSPGALFLLDWHPVFWSTREEYFRQLAVQLAGQGITPIFVPSELRDKEVLRRFEAAGALVEPCSYHHGPWRYFQHIHRFNQQFSIQFAHVRFFDYFSGVPWLSRLAGIRNIYFTEANSGEWNAQGSRRHFARLRTALMCGPITGMIAISDFIRRRLELVGVPASRIRVIHNGVDTSCFRPNQSARQSIRQDMGAVEGTIVLLFAAVFLAWKRPGVAIQTCAELVARGVDVQLWMAGDGPLRPDLEREAKRLSVDSNIRWLGHQKEPQKWMAAADLFLHTAIGEAFGNVLVEAMACGLPVFATNSGAAPEIVQEGRSGRLISPGPREASQVAEAISEIMNRPDVYADWARYAQETAAIFTTDICVEKTMDFYSTFGNRPS